MTSHNLPIARRLRDAARRVRRSDALRAFGALPGTVRYHAAPASTAWRFDVNAAMGMGGMLTHAVALLHIAQNTGIRARLAFTNPLYARTPGDDWFGDFFIQHGAAAEDEPMRHLAIRNHWDYAFLTRTAEPTLAEARAIFDSRLGFSAEADAVLAGALAGLPPIARTIGVHYRGTDKVFEAQRTGADAMIESIRHAREISGLDTVFLATDEDSFGQRLADAFPDLTITSWQHATVERRPGVPIHFSAGDGHAKGMEAVTLIRLLARTGMLVRTASYLSGWSQVLNPALPTLFVNPFALATPMFPDRDLLMAAPFARTG